ncbi:hypothetical protein EGM51_09915 [Verrucomicrobia bacterium S94]|nr:hypothetical protein EGM51_09915 [Verrucomicrobia bacterium S94]
MDYYQGIVAEYLDADRSVFVNNECFLQLEPGNNPPKGTSWYCDIVAVNLRESSVYLYEVTFSSSLHALLQRLKSWDSNWDSLCTAIRRDCSIPCDWKIQPWVFIPEDRRPILDAKHNSSNMPDIRITHLESIVPWKYKSWNRTKDAID